MVGQGPKAPARSRLATGVVGKWPGLIFLKRFSNVGAGYFMLKFYSSEDFRPLAPAQSPINADFVIF
jgi:hypothetical protein